MGKVLRLVGISSPEDAQIKREDPDGPPSWRNPVAPKLEPKVEPVKAEGGTGRK